jgi:hypothetical protein
VTSDIVVDSCVAVKWVVPEPDSALAQQVAVDVSFAGGRLIVLDLGLIEVAQALWKLFHRGQLPAHEVPNLLPANPPAPPLAAPADALSRRPLSPGGNYLEGRRGIRCNP